MAGARVVPNKGDRIELLKSIPGIPELKAGQQGTVVYTATVVAGQLDINVKWDSGKVASIISPIDQFKIVEQGDTKCQE